MHEVLQPIFPQVMGTEEETRITFYAGAKAITKPSHDDPAYGPRAQLAEFGTISPPLPGSFEFRENGSRIYSDHRCVELATPETVTPHQNAVYIAANATLFHIAIGDLASRLAQKQGRSLTVIQQRRTRDAHANTWGDHDNLSVRNSPQLEFMKQAQTTQGWFLQTYLFTRNFITGAGQIDSRGAHFSQKMSVPTNDVINSHSFTSSLYRIDSDHGHRLELRCGDINILDWAVETRTGSGALAAAAVQTNIVHTMRKHYSDDFLGEMTSSNHIPLKPNFTLQRSRQLMKALDFQEHFYETVLSGFTGHTGEKIPEEYQQVGKEALDFIVDMRQVLTGKAELDILATRADWAAKLVLMRLSSKRNGRNIQIGDMQSRTVDFAYDRITTVADTKGSIDITMGAGYKLRDKHCLITDDEVADAMFNPPRETRAALRTAKALEFGSAMTYCRWNDLSYRIAGQPLLYSLDALLSSDPSYQSSIGG